MLNVYTIYLSLFDSVFELIGQYILQQFIFNGREKIVKEYLYHIWLFIYLFIF